MPGAKAAPEAVLLVAGAAGLAWRCRLELAIVSVLALAFVLLAGVIGELAAGVLVPMACVAVLTVRRSRRVLVRWRGRRRSWRAWWRAWTDCELPRVHAGHVTTIPAGELMRVRASRGSSLEHVERRAEELAECLQAQEIRIARDPDNAATGTVTLARRDPLAGLVSVVGRTETRSRCRSGTRSRSASTSSVRR